MSQKVPTYEIKLTVEAQLILKSESFYNFLVHPEGLLFCGDIHMDYSYISLKKIQDLRGVEEGFELWLPQHFVLYIFHGSNKKSFGIEIAESVKSSPPVQRNRKK